MRKQWKPLKYCINFCVSFKQCVVVSLSFDEILKVKDQQCKRHVLRKEATDSVSGVVISARSKRSDGSTTSLACLFWRSHLASYVKAKIMCN